MTTTRIRMFPNEWASYTQTQHPHTHTKSIHTHTCESVQATFWWKFSAVCYRFTIHCTISIMYKALSFTSNHSSFLRAWARARVRVFVCLFCLFEWCCFSLFLFLAKEKVIWNVWPSVENGYIAWCSCSCECECECLWLVFFSSAFFIYMYTYNIHSVLVDFSIFSISSTFPENKQTILRENKNDTVSTSEWVSEWKCILFLFLSLFVCV